MGDRGEMIAVHDVSRRVMSRLATLAIVVALAGLLGAPSAPVSAATTTYGFWNADGCYYTWMGPADTFRKGDCGPANYAAWVESQSAGVQQLHHWDGRQWQFQGFYSKGTMDTPDGIFIVPFFSDGQEHVFIWDYTDKTWYHFLVFTQSVQSVGNATVPEPELETTDGWFRLSEFNDPTLGTLLAEWERLQGILYEA